MQEVVSGLPGYKSNDILSVQSILPYLSHSSKIVTPERIHIYDSLESTNITAKEMAQTGAEHDTIVIANYQTAGKGRQGKTFHSPPDHGLYMTIILHASELSFSTPTLVTALAAVSVCEAIESIVNKAPQIKWVNDVFLDGKKICGILTESVSMPDSPGVQRIILGIGVNFSTPPAEFPEELQHIAGSLFGTEKPSITRNQLAAEIINRIISPDNQHNEKEMLEKYRKRMFLLGKKVTVTGTGETYEATAVDIDDTGQLVARKDNGEILLLSSGDISASWSSCN